MGSSSGEKGNNMEGWKIRKTVAECVLSGARGRVRSIQGGPRRAEDDRDRGKVKEKATESEPREKKD